MSDTIEDSNVTRHLCAAAYLDDRFADRVVRELLTSGLRAVACSPGTDVANVLAHCLTACHRRQQRDITILLVASLSITLSFVSKWALVPGVLAIYFLIVTDLNKTFKIVITHFAATKAETPLRTRHASEEWILRRLSAIRHAMHGNVSIYSGFSPFVGYGPQVSGWSFTIPLIAAKSSHEVNGTKGVIPFTSLELTADIRAQLKGTFKPGVGIQLRWDQLEGAVVEDRVFASGNTLNGDFRLLPNRRRPPCISLNLNDLEDIASNLVGCPRHYLCIHVPSWAGKVVASTFLQVSTDQRMLHIECARTILGPIPSKFRVADRYPDGLPLRKQIALLGKGAAALIPLTLAAPIRVARRANFSAGAASRYAKEARRASDDHAYDYGARTSVRELAADPNYHNYFQMQDAGKHLKITEQHILSAILDFLDEHNIDTTEFRNNQLITLLNQGIIQSGGISIVGNQAIGREATATQRFGRPSDSQGQTPPPAARILSIML